VNEHFDIKFNSKGENPMDKETEGLFFKVKWFYEEKLENGEQEEKALEKMVIKYKINGQDFLKWYKEQKEKEKNVPQIEKIELNPPSSAVLEFLELTDEEKMSEEEALKIVGEHYEKKHGHPLIIKAFNDLLKTVRENVEKEEKEKAVEKKPKEEVKENPILQERPKKKWKRKKYSEKEISDMWYNKM